ncbi:DUF924 family protein [Vibrio maerlii]|uniref:DUF924 family protein n=1 Tax=Vibrio maerlii TaxID=2231648 RepID=UPI000E3BE1FD|nr:DUF924 family protein [Vibrio maerlii]
MHKEIIDFWFNELEPQQWWEKDEAFDQMIKSRFGRVHEQAIAGELYLWRESAKGCLAEVIVLDQFSRNIYRDTPNAFASDAMALVLAQSAISRGLDKDLTDIQRVFLCMPYMHSESRLIHVEAVKLFEAIGIENNLEFEHKHKAIIDRFGRYPHRNEILRRESTDAERDFLEQPDSGF